MFIFTTTFLQLFSISLSNPGSSPRPPSSTEQTPTHQPAFRPSSKDTFAVRKPYGDQMINQHFDSTLLLQWTPNDYFMYCRIFRLLVHQLVLSLCGFASHEMELSYFWGCDKKQPNENCERSPGARSRSRVSRSRHYGYLGWQWNSSSFKEISCHQIPF